MSKLTLNEFAEKFSAGEFANGSRKTQIGAGWYDWFCRDSSLASKTAALGKKVLVVMKSSKIDTSKFGVMFKNNSPMAGNLYDDFRIYELKTGNFIFTVVPSSGFSATKGRAEVWGAENGYKVPLVTGTWRDVKEFFGV